MLFLCFCYHETNIYALILNTFLVSSPHEAFVVKYHATSKKFFGNMSKLVARGRISFSSFCSVPSFFKSCCCCIVQCAFLSAISWSVAIVVC